MKTSMLIFREMNIEERMFYFEDFIKNLDSKAKLRELYMMIRTTTHENEMFFYAKCILRKGDLDLENLILREYFRRQEDWKYIYESPIDWTHEILSLTESLWQHKKYDWIKKIHERAFEIAENSGDYNYCEILASLFAEYAPYDCWSIDFGFTIPVINSINWQKMNWWIQKRVNWGKCNSERDHLRLKFQCYIDQVKATWVDGSVLTMTETIKQLQDIGDPASDIIGVLEELVQKRVHELMPLYPPNSYSGAPLSVDDEHNIDFVNSWVDTLKSVSALRERPVQAPTVESK